MIETIYNFIGFLLVAKGIAHLFATMINVDEGNFGNAGFNAFMILFTAIVFTLYVMVRTHS